MTAHNRFYYPYASLHECADSVVEGGGAVLLAEDVSRRARNDVPVGVEIMVAHEPVQKSGRMVFWHPAVASGEDSTSPQWTGMEDRCREKPAVNEPHPAPQPSAAQATPRGSAMPDPFVRFPVDRLACLALESNHDVVNKPPPLYASFVHSISPV